MFRFGFRLWRTTSLGPPALFRNVRKPRNYLHRFRFFAWQQRKQALCHLRPDRTLQTDVANAGNSALLYHRCDVP